MTTPHVLPLPEDLLTANVLWKEAIDQKYPKFFEESAGGQTPKVDMALLSRINLLTYEPL